MRERKIKPKAKHILHGVPASPGIAISKVFLLTGESVKINPDNIRSESPSEEIEKLQSAISKAKSELRSLQSRVERRIGRESARIFDVHQLLLEDSLTNWAACKTSSPIGQSGCQIQIRRIHSPQRA